MQSHRIENLKLSDNGSVTDVALADAVGRRRSILPDSQILRHARSLGIYLGE